MHRTRHLPLLLAGVLFAAACSQDQNVTGPAQAGGPSLNATSAGGAVYTTSNAADGNAILGFARQPDGSLTGPRVFPTGGLGTGAGLGNQGGLISSPNGRFLFAVNAGSDEISVFRLAGREPQLVETVPSGGSMPLSLTMHGDLLYVLNGGGAGNIAGFRVDPAGHLSPVPNSVQPLSGAGVGPAEISFNPAGTFLVVSEKGTSMLTVYPVGSDGAAGAPAAHVSSGMTPFGFAFNQQGALVVSEAFGGAPGASAASSYVLHQDGRLDLVSGSVGTTQTAACWIAITPNGRFAYTTNTGSASVSAYRVGPGSAQLTLLAPAAGTTGAGPIDAAIGGSFLYTLNSGGHSLSGFQVGPDGRLTGVGETTGLPAGANGLVAF